MPLQHLHERKGYGDMGDMGDMKPADPRMVVAVKGFIRRNGRVLLIRRTQETEVGGGTWEGVGGKIEFGEQPEEALVREVREEVGLRVTVGRLLYASSFVSGPGRHVLILSYLCGLAPEETDDRIALSCEHDAWQWADEAVFRQNVHPGILQDAERFDVMDSFFEWD